MRAKCFQTSLPLYWLCIGPMYWKRSSQAFLLCCSGDTVMGEVFSNCWGERLVISQTSIFPCESFCCKHWSSIEVDSREIFFPRNFLQLQYSKEFLKQSRTNAFKFFSIIFFCIFLQLYECIFLTKFCFLIWVTCTNKNFYTCKILSYFMQNLTCSLKHP